jgi:PLP dependent protein
VGVVSQVAENLREVEGRIARAAQKCGREAREIRLVAVTKTHPVSVIREALAAGVRELGENYVQEAQQKFAQLDATGVTRHLIGHLQTNKAGKAIELFDVVQSVDSLELARALSRRAGAIGRTPDVLVEVNISGEASKYGVAPEQALDFAGAVAQLPGVRLQGFMGIGSFEAGEAEKRRSFSLLARLYDALPREHRRVLSMGMTGDFELAILEGSTMVRVGTAIFGARRSSGG